MQGIINANIYTMDEAKPNAEAMLFEQGKITFIGSNQEALEKMNGNGEVLDLQGKTVIPGFNDAHVHFLKGGQSLSYIDLTKCRSVEEIIRQGKNYLETHNLPEGTWIMGRGWDQFLFENPVFPTKHDLDQISDKYPIAFVRSCEHAILVNSLAIEKCGVAKDSPQPAGGEYGKFPDGELNGLFVDLARDVIYDQIPEPDKDQIKELIKLSLNVAAEKGVTSIQTDDFWSIASKDYRKVIQAYQELEKEGALTARIYEQCVLEKEEALDVFLAEGYKTGQGSDFFKIGPFKMFADGGVGVGSAYLFEPYQDEPDQYGCLNYPVETMKGMMKKAQDAGMQLTAHAIGDKATSICLDIFQELGAERASVIHAHLLTPQLLRQFAENEVITIGDAVEMIDDMPMFERRLGKERERLGYNYRTLLDLKGKLAMASDWPVSQISPITNLYTAVTRRDANHLPKDGWIPEEKIMVEEALKAYTVGSAYCSYEEDRKGTLTAGKLADFVVLSHDILQISVDDIPLVQVEKTFVNGQEVFSK